MVENLNLIEFQRWLLYCVYAALIGVTELSESWFLSKASGKFAEMQIWGKDQSTPYSSVEEKCIENTLAPSFLTFALYWNRVRLHIRTTVFLKQQESSQ